jgi:hypothetical protein
MERRAAVSIHKSQEKGEQKMKINKKPEIHLLSGESSCWDVAKAIERLAEQQGGYTWQPVDVMMVVPATAMMAFDSLIEKAEPALSTLLAGKESDWTVIVPALAKLVPPSMKPKIRVMLLDMLLVTYAANIGVAIPYIGGAM